MARLSNLAKMIRNANNNSVAETFVDDLLYSISQDNKNERPRSKSFKPSGISGCERALYYEITGAQHDSKVESVELVGICESGTDRHEILQNYIQNMHQNSIECDWLDVSKYLHAKGIVDPQVVTRVGNETKLWSKKYNMRFMCDGVIRYKGKIYILEIKTESTHKYNKHIEPWASHIQQATCYAMTLDIRDVIFLYENRDNCSKKAYLVHVTDKMIERVESIINRVTKCVEEGVLPAPDPNKCNYCNYKNQCKLDGGTL